jgi:hypothetical protein
MARSFVQVGSCWYGGLRVLDDSGEGEAPFIHRSFSDPQLHLLTSPLHQRRSSTGSSRARSAPSTSTGARSAWPARATSSAPRTSSPRPPPPHGPTQPQQRTRRAATARRDWRRRKAWVRFERGRRGRGTGRSCWRCGRRTSWATCARRSAPIPQRTRTKSRREALGGLAARDGGVGGGVGERGGRVRRESEGARIQRGRQRPVGRTLEIRQGAPALLLDRMLSDVSSSIQAVFGQPCTYRKPGSVQALVPAGSIHQPALSSPTSTRLTQT